MRPGKRWGHATMRLIGLGCFAVILGSIFATAVQLLGAAQTDDRILTPPEFRGEPAVETNHRFFLPLNNPQYVRGDQAWFMRESDYVIGVVNRGRKRAYPWAVLANVHIVNDTLAGDHIVVAHCEVCGAASAFRVPRKLRGLRFAHASFNPRRLTRQGLSVEDSVTNSAWQIFAGRAIEGRLAGAELERLTSFVSSWGEWIATNPNTEVVFLSPEMRRRPHGMGHFPADRSVYPGKTQQQFENYLRSTSKLLWRNPAELVVGVFDKTEKTRAAKAWPVVDLIKQGPTVLTVQVGKRRAIVIVRPSRSGAAPISVFNGALGERDLKLSWHDRARSLLEDVEGNLWNVWGECVQGRRRGQRLETTNSYITKWYEWVENFPETQLAGQRLDLTVAQALVMARTRAPRQGMTPWKN